MCEIYESMIIISDIIGMMKRHTAKDYLERSLRRLENWIPFSVSAMMEGYLDPEVQIPDYDFEEDENGYAYIIFSWPETDSERVVLLVYDERMRIIADLSAVQTDVNSLLYSQEFFDDLCEESDWMYLEHYTLCAALFDDLVYPPCENEIYTEHEGQVLLYSNAYVTRSFRKQGIFSRMLLMCRDFALRKQEGSTRLYSVISLDPDIAVYGPDANDEPYHYNFEKDEPVRTENRKILEHLGFETVRLEETEYDPEADGTKLWFAYRQETDLIIDVDEKTRA